MKEILNGTLRSPAILFLHHGETFLGKLARLEEEQRVACTNCIMFHSVSDAMFVRGGTLVALKYLLRYR